MENFDLVKVELEPEVSTAVQEANSLMVQSHEQDEVATVFVGQIKETRAKVDSRRKKMKAPALETCQEIDAFFNELLDPIDKAIAVVKGKQRVWFLEEDRKRQEAEAKERARAAEEERKKREAIQAQADAARAKGKEEKAAMLEEKAENTFVPPVIPPSSVPKTTSSNGYSSTRAASIDLQLVDLKAVAAKVADGTYPIYFIDVNMAKAKRHFMDSKTPPGPQPGFMIYPDVNVRSGRAK
jgi:hypothetical protein